METLFTQTLNALQAGKTLLYPTDTIWGIGCDARNAEAVKRLYAIKRRDSNKSMLILCTESVINPTVCPLLTTNSDRPTTYILPKPLWKEVLQVPIAPSLVAADGSLGIRLPRHLFCQKVIDRLRAPIVSTSANLSGEPSPRSHHDISPEIFSRIDFCVPPLAEFESHRSQGSRIVKLMDDGSLAVLRP